MELLNDSKNQTWTPPFFRGLILLFFIILTARVFDLQIIRGKYFKSLSEDNRVRSIPIQAKRGNIEARGGEIIADSIEVKKSVFFDSNNGVSGLISEWDRRYVSGAEFAHVIGYLGEINEDELGKVSAKCIEKGESKFGNLIGRGGLEEEYDCDLRGTSGQELIEVDAFGKMVRTLGRKKPIDGQNLKTTIDFGLQKMAFELLKDKKGVIIVSDKEGELLTLVSTPSFDPNIFVKDGNNTQISQVLNDKSLPLLNRAIGGKYHPGSIYKPLVAIAGLEEGVIDEDYLYEDTGRIITESAYGSYSFSNWYFLQYGGVEGKINLVRALARSTDTFFYKLGELLGVDKLAEWSNKFGLGDKTKVDLPGEVAGLVPDSLWKERVIGERWFLGNTYNMSIGQGDLAVTPIEIHTVITAVANGGKICSPHLTKKGQECKDLQIKKENIDLVKKGMIAVCSVGGTAYTFFDFEEKNGIKVACKTGTAQNVNLEPHSWFTAFAPYDSPEIIVTVLVEEGGEGSKVAGPIAREIFNNWFDRKSKL